MGETTSSASMEGLSPSAEGKGPLRLGDEIDIAIARAD